MEFVDPGDARGLLIEAWAGGVVLDYVIVACDEDPGDGETLRRVVLFTARGLCAVRGLLQGPEIDPSSIPGRRIPLDKFYGWRIDRQRRRVLMLGHDLVKKDPDRYQQGEPNEFGVVYFRTPWIWSDDPDEPIEIEGVGVAGYGDAFLEPPYSITLQPRAAQDLFFAIDDALLKRPDAETEIWKFGSDWEPEGAWSPYFEWNWWHSCMWTVRTGRREVVVIGASASD